MADYEYSNLKEIYIELKNYKFFHSPSTVDKIDERFRGRNQIETKLYNILTKSEVKSGAYLITGYRGVGKTSLINKVLFRLVHFNLPFKLKKINPPIIVKINLGHEELKEKDILNSIAKSLLDKYINWHSKLIFSILSITFIPSYIAFCILYLSEIIGLEDIYTFFKAFSSFKISSYISINSKILDTSFFIVSTILFFKLIRFLIHRTFYNIFPNHFSAIKKLIFLNNRIDTYITEENKISIKNSYLNKLFSKKLAYTIAGSRDIEIALLDIFEYIDRIKFFFKPKFIFVFDELDKIEAHRNTTIIEKEEFLKNSKYTTNAELTRSRQEATSKILANLKHFFSTARAKFIFIAGREMYDATLGDISNRNYFLGSIFHDVIYINSFLTEDPVSLKTPSEDSYEFSHVSYYHSMAEEFVCQFLMPKKFDYKDKDKKYKARLDNPKRIRRETSKWIKFGFLKPERRKSISLKTYNLYLEACSGLSQTDIKKIIFSLNQFIIYLSHRSSGSPKKMTHLLENYICKDNNWLSRGDNQYREIRYLSVVDTSRKRNRDTLFLHFDYYSQHVFGFTNYLSIPYYYNISRYVRRYNDKLMVSTSYLIDHLYKFHDFGFSWRNLEVTPEIIDVNKAPTLRKLIEDIVTFLSYTHLQYIVSGLYDFKFKKKISYEINFLSKISDRESAALNFTLDESQEVKGHFYKKLEIINKDYSNKINEDYIHSKGYIQQSLADLYYYDQEYDDASVIYKDAIQSIRSNDNEEISIRLIIVLSRIMLKLALSFEKKKAYTSAFMAYVELSDLILSSIEIELEKIGYVKLKENNDINVYKVGKDGKLGSKENEFFINYFTDIFNQPISSESHRGVLKTTVLETVRLLYQPFIAKLHVQNKEKLGGITDADIELTLKEVSFLTKVTNPILEKKILSEYHNKIGDLLFFSNYNTDKYDANFMYLNALKLFAQSTDPTSEQNDNVVDIIFDYLINQESDRLSFEELKMVASNLSDYGDSLLSEVNKDDQELNFNIDTLDLLEKIIQDPKKLDSLKKDIISVYNNGRLNTVFCCYALSYYFYFKNDDHSKASFQFIKILHVLEINKSELIKIFDNISRKKDFFEKLKKIVEKILYSIYRSYHSSTRQEIDRIKSIFKLRETKDIDREFHYILNNLPSISEAHEVLMLYKLLTIDFGIDNPISNSPDGIKEYLQKYNPSIYSSFNGMYSRLNNLYIKVKVNHQVFSVVKKEYKEYFERPTDFPTTRINTTLQSNWEVIKHDRELIKYLIADSIYCLTEMIRILKIFGVTYITNHSTFGFAYEKRSVWCNYFDDYDAIERDPKCHIERANEDDIGKTTLYITIRNLIGSQAMSNLKAKYNLEKAISHYVKSIESHNGKFAYDRMTENLYYLDNDFNDNHLHFFASLERYKIKIRDTYSKIQNCKNELHESKIYDVDNYMKK